MTSVIRHTFRSVWFYFALFFFFFLIHSVDYSHFSAVWSSYTWTVNKLCQLFNEIESYILCSDLNDSQKRETAGQKTNKTSDEKKIPSTDFLALLLDLLEIFALYFLHHYLVVRLIMFTTWRTQWMKEEEEEERQKGRERERWRWKSKTAILQHTGDAFACHCFMYIDYTTFERNVSSGNRSCRKK